MGLFSNVKNAKVTADLSFLGRGHYWLRVNRTFTSENRVHIPYCAIDFTVVAVLPSNEVAAHRVGEDIRRHIAAGEYFDKEIQSYLMGSGVMTEADLASDKAGKSNNFEEACEMIFPKKEDGKPFAASVQQGWVIECDNRDIQIADTEKDPQKTQGITRPFTKIKFVREVPAAEVLSGDKAMGTPPLPKELVERFFPNNMLQQAVAKAGK